MPSSGGVSTSVLEGQELEARAEENRSLVLAGRDHTRGKPLMKSETIAHEDPGIQLRSKIPARRQSTIRRTNHTLTVIGDTGDITGSREPQVRK